jgi:hypothetical protein
LIRPIDHRSNREIITSDGDERVDELGRKKTPIIGVDYLALQRKEQSEGLYVLPLATEGGGFDDDCKVTHDAGWTRADFARDRLAFAGAARIDEDPRQVGAGVPRATIRRKTSQELTNLRFELAASLGQCRREACFDAMEGTFGESGVRKGWLGR